MTTTQQTALQLAARKLVEAQEQAASPSRMGAYDLTPLHNTLNALGQALEAAGATYQPTDRPQADPHGLEALRRIEASRGEADALCTKLLAALFVAEYLDRARGNWVGDMAHTDRGETPGTDYAEAIQALLLRLEGELGVEGDGRE